MGAQNTKDRVVTTGSLSVRTTKTKPRLPKDGRQIGSNIFTEHSGMNHFFYRIVFGVFFPFYIYQL